jgi:cytochrome P450
VLFGPEFTRDPYPSYAALRRDAPVSRVRLPGGLDVWLVTRYDDARQALADPRLSRAQSASNGRRLTSGMFNRALTQHMLSSDPPDHTRLRRLVSGVFTPRRIELLRPRIAEIAEALLAGVDGEVDLVETFAFPLPIQVICELLGIPVADRDRFREWSDVVVSGPAAGAQLGPATDAMLAYIRALLDDRRAHPVDDLLGGLVNARDDADPAAPRDDASPVAAGDDASPVAAGDDASPVAPRDSASPAAPRDGGDRLSDDELCSMVFLLLVAGHETTVNLIGNAVLRLIGDPALAERLRTSPEALPATVEEFLRYEGPVALSTYRRSVESVTIGDVEIPAGETVVVSLLSANRDERRFAAADTFDADRADGGHLAFGHGIHYCLGAPLARAEAQIGLDRLLARFRTVELTVAAEELTFRPGVLMRGVTALPVRLGR